ncbi:MAG TPA: RcpC/CpaB family pilus assembly protein [Candidatus Limnocylindria bacterium]|nr:RcpC/CpaB family pilus assembly protein [Candidatus Limnocylindria bacterium]
MAILVGGVVLVALQGSAMLREPVEMRAVVVAVRDIASRKPIEEGDVAIREVVADPTNETAYTLIEDVLGRVSGVPIATGQLVTRNMLAASSTGQAYSILEAGEEYDPSGPELRAVSVNVPDDRAVAGTLLPGQWVDLVVTLAINPALGVVTEDPEASTEPGTEAGFVAGPSTKVTLQMLTVLARNGTIYILRTDLATAEKIAELTAAGGQFTLVLRPDEDDRVADTTGSTLDMLLDEFGFPIPEQPALEEQPPAN